MGINVIILIPSLVIKTVNIRKLGTDQVLSKTFECCMYYHRENIVQKHMHMNSDLTHDPLPEHGNCSNMGGSIKGKVP